MIKIRDGKIRIHTSDRLQFRRCRRKAYLASKLFLGLQPIRPNNTLWLGSGVHKGIEMYYGFGLDATEVFAQWAEEGIDRIKKSGESIPSMEDKFNESLELGYGMLEHYKQFAAKYDDFKVHILPNGQPAVELLFEVPITHPVTGEELYAYFTEAKEGMSPAQLADLKLYGQTGVPVVYGGKIDMITEDIFGNLWIFDHKTCKTFGDWSKLTLDTQVGSYIWAIEKMLPLKKHLSGVVYNGLKKVLPKPPEPLKKGGFSVNKQQNTTYDVYLQALLDHGLARREGVVLTVDPAYHEMLAHLHNQDVVTDDEITTKFFKRKKVKRSREEVISMGRDIYDEACDIVQATAFYPNPNRDCSWDCDFYDVCHGVNNHEDVSYQLKTLYEPRPEETDEAMYAWSEE